MWRCRWKLLIRLERFRAEAVAVVAGHPVEEEVNVGSSSRSDESLVETDSSDACALVESLINLRTS